MRNAERRRLRRLLDASGANVVGHLGENFPLNEDGRGDWIRTSDPHTPSVMRYQAALRPDLASPLSWTATGHLVRRASQGKVQAGGMSGAAKTAGKSGVGAARRCSLLAAIPALYLLAALVGSLVPVNRGWSEPDAGRHHLPRR